ncbi:MAG TPA: signal peptidase I [Thermoanaerobaculia bacterium]|nr:signal peptidase I [Thermoanaerobaculia bacterium]
MGTEQVGGDAAPTPPLAAEARPDLPLPAGTAALPDDRLERPAAREYFEALLIAIIFATFARTYVFQAFKIPSGSMERNLLVGDHILVNKFVYGPQACAPERWLLPEREVRRGDVVVFRWPRDPSRDFIKRAVGLPGDTVRLIDKQLYVNDKRVEDGAYVSHIDSVIYPRSSVIGGNPSRDNFGPVTVPPASYFCLGDNRDNSQDSRFWGMVPRKYLKGRALLVYWSFQSDSPEVIEGTGLGAKLRQLGQVAFNFLGRTRWDRTFRLVR